MSTSMAGNINRVWELDSIENLGVGMGSIVGMNTLDFRHETQLIFLGDEQPATWTYKIVDREVQLFDNDGKQFRIGMALQIDKLTEDELHLLLVATELKKDLVRLRYRPKG